MVLNTPRGSQILSPRAHGASYHDQHKLAEYHAACSAQRDCLCVWTGTDEVSVVILLLADTIQQPSPVRRGDDGSVTSKAAENQNAMLASAITDSRTSVSCENKHAALSVESGLSA